MEWRTKRKLLYGSVVALLITIVALVVVYFIFFTNQPTCFDGIKNGSERGVDCGGSCNLVCTMDAKLPEVSQAGIFRVQSGIYNGVAVVRNPNIDFGAYDVQYTISAIDDLGREYSKREGVIDLLPGITVPIFEPSLRISDSVNIVDTKISFGDIVWVKNIEQKKNVSVSTSLIENEDTQPFLSGSVTNNEAVAVGSQQIIALVSDDQGNPVGVSSTVVDPIAKGQSKDIFFTWPEPFYVGSRICDAQSGRRISSFLGDVAIVIDRSGSMDDESKDPPEPLTTVKLAAIRFAQSLGTNDMAGVISFANEASIDSFLSSNRIAISQTIDRIDILEDGVQNTNLADGLLKAMETLMSDVARNERKAIVLLTDGVATRPTNPENPDYPEEFALSVATTIKQNNIEVYVIGLGSEVNEKFLREVVSAPENYYGVEAKEELDNIYDNIASDICSNKPAIVKTYVKPFE